MAEEVDEGGGGARFLLANTVDSRRPPRRWLLFGGQGEEGSATRGSLGLFITSGGMGGMNAEMGLQWMWWVLQWMWWVRREDEQGGYNGSASRSCGLWDGSARGRREMGWLGRRATTRGRECGLAGLEREKGNRLEEKIQPTGFSRKEKGLGI